MNGKLAVRAGIAGALLALTMPALAAPVAAKAPAAEPTKTRFKTFETWGWKADLPDNMDQAGKERTDPKKPQMAKWMYFSENKSVQLTVSTHPVVAGKKFEDIAKYAYFRFLKEHEKPEILRMRQFKSGKREVAYFIAKVKEVRNAKPHNFVYFRLVVRAQRAIAYLTLGVADTRISEFLEIAEKLVDTFNLAEAASVAKAVQAKGGKVAIVKDLPPAPKAAGKK